MQSNDTNAPVDDERRRFLGTAAMTMAAAGAFSLFRGEAMAAPGKADVRPFRAHIPEADVLEMRRRAGSTRWPDRETVGDESQGLQLDRLKALVAYWANGYDWRKVERELNALPQFVTTLDGLDVHFIHVRSPHSGAMPLILTHGWPGSVLEFLKVIGPLTDPVAHGGKAEDAFHLVIPSIPGYGFSERPREAGWGPDRIGRAWDVLMKRLGYARYVSQGGDHGSVISDTMARQMPAGLLGIHLTMPATVPTGVIRAINAGDPAPSGLSVPERAAFDALNAFFSKNAAYGAMMVTRPQTVGYALNDSPAGLAGWMYDKFVQWTDSNGQPERVLTRDEMLDDISLYWLTGTVVSAARFYWENHNNNFSAIAQKTEDIRIPVAISVFPGEIYRAPRSWAAQAYRTLYYFNEVGKGGHFAAWEQPRLFADELRSAFRPLRSSL
ncbi:alpha/beta fold hydrolase [Lysobacter sp. GCM10012299]|uniref:alpha/beta fold hydrolase n=1 Tax=Lysobacter sp. GCM10012299 TaxID=3317333 RepID=UPI00360F0952